jgi:4-amino-4-deoxy-L-arabinose transferase-like glycosyltransferase
VIDKARYKRQYFIWWIIGIALAARLAIIPILGPANENLYEYGQIAWNIVQGHGFSWDFDGRFALQPTAYSPALYCYTLVPWFAIFGLDLTGPRIMHAVLLALVCWFLYKTGEKLVNRNIGLIAAAIWAVYPETVFMSVRMVIENVMFLPMLWLLFLSQTMRAKQDGYRALGCGVLLGLSCWVNPSLQILGPIIPVFWWINGHLKGRPGLKRLVLFVFGAMLVITPWTIRNYMKLGAFVPLRSAFAYNMWRGNHEGATGTIRTMEGADIDEAVSPEYKAYYEAHMVPDEIERDRFFAQEVRKFIFANPREYLRLSIIRFYYLWWRDVTHPLTSNPFYILPWIFVLAFAGLGSVLISNNLRFWSLWWLQIIGFTMLFSLTVVVPRYRLPVYPAMFLLAAVGLEKTYQFIRKLSTASS